MSSLPKKSRRASRAKRGQQTARIWQFEQLESRAMLAVMGPMPYNGGDHGPQMQTFHESYRFETTMVAPSQFQQNWAASPVDHGWGERPMQGGFHGGRMMFSEYDEIDALNAGPPNLSHSNLMQAPPPPPMDFGPPATMTITAGFNPRGNSYVAVEVDHPAMTNSYGASGNTFPNTPHPNDFVNPAATYVLNPLGGNPKYGGANGAAAEGWLLSTYAVSQPTTREVESASFAWTTALDAALQSYTSQLLLTTNPTSGQLTTSMKSSDQSSPTSDSVDDFIHLSEATSQDLFAVSTDAIAQERADVEAVLDSLKDADSLPSKLSGDEVANAITAPQDQDGQIADLVFGSAFDLADADGGMVLLKATGDANESPINLASVAEAHPDLFSGHVGVEPSVGLYQAIDMGFEELSASENMPVAKPSAQPSQQVNPDNHYSANSSKAGNNTYSRKSAAALTVSTLAGGLLWVASRKRSDDGDAKEQFASQLVR